MDQSHFYPALTIPGWNSWLFRQLQHRMHNELLACCRCVCFPRILITREETNKSEATHFFQQFRHSHMDSALHEVWVAASTSPFVPTIGKDSHFLVGFSLLVLGLALSGGFVISMPALGSIRRTAVTDSIARPFPRQPARPWAPSLVGPRVGSTHLPACQWRIR